MAHRRKNSGQVRINFGQVDLSRILPHGQAENVFFVVPCLNVHLPKVLLLLASVITDRKSGLLPCLFVPSGNASCGDTWN